MHQSNQETQNLDQDSSDHDSDSGSEDAHDGGGITQNLDQDSSDHDSNSGSEDAHDGGGITNLHQDSSDNRSENAHDVDDITSLHADPESNELPPNLSQTTESSIFSFEDSVDFGVFEPLWQSFSDSESIGSGEEFPMEDSTDNEESTVNETAPLFMNEKEESDTLHMADMDEDPPYLAVVEGPQSPTINVEQQPDGVWHMAQTQSIPVLSTHGGEEGRRRQDVDGVGTDIWGPTDGDRAGGSEEADGGPMELSVFAGSRDLGTAAATSIIDVARVPEDWGELHRTLD
ncbi:hypothetical protein Q8A67_007304 [Cirrhinus molitorella]|uniref:Uncharacterized protein n=1 Tax=Cirrhinus molitorella TaxID=172907 RepID=A0AA88PVW4_9TELE|nr:hypothetical protein Q8A67_007304 [Cirrhinus molitorella]